MMTKIIFHGIGKISEISKKKRDKVNNYNVSKNITFAAVKT